jgi:methionyl-tRNA formyltransferase
LVVSQADKRRGRSGRISASPVKAVAQELGIPVTSRVRDVLDVDADLGVLVAFGRIISTEILEHLTIVNLHPSLLPRWRGATPGEAAIMAGDHETGICLMQLAEEMDAGPIYTSWKTFIQPQETASALYERLFEKGNEMLVELLSDELPTPEPQQGEPTYCGRFSSADFRIDWTQPAERIQRLTRIGRPWTTFRDRRVVVVSATADVDKNIGKPGELQGVDVQTGEGVLSLSIVQPEGKAAMDARSWTNGLRLAENETFQ